MKILSFGEILLRLASPGYTKLFQKDNLEATFCGGEANVAVSLSILGLDSVFVTKLPNNDVGIAAASSLRYFGVDTSKVVYGEGRVGLYYLEKGASQRPSKVTYDRAGSAISIAELEDFDWDTLFNGVDWFHWTGINPALSHNMEEISRVACKEAKKRNIMVSCDLNYRGKLWTTEEAKRVMCELLRYVDICIANEEDADKVLGLKTIRSDASKGKICNTEYIHIAERIHRIYGCKYVATTLRKSHSASVNGWSAMLYDSEKAEAYFSKEYEIQLIDRVGGGDSFAAGLIYGLVKKMCNEDIIEFATAASCLKQTIEGDYNRTTVEDINNLLRSGGNGRVQR